jgi:hypothetical protein
MGVTARRNWAKLPFHTGLLHSFYTFAVHIELGSPKSGIHWNSVHGLDEPELVLCGKRNKQMNSKMHPKKAEI